MSSKFPNYSESREDFAEKLRGMKEDRESASLPPVDICMWPEEFYWRDDINDSDQFNERYIETRAHADYIRFLLYLFSAFHTVVVLVVIAGALISGISIGSFILYAIFGGGCVGLFLFSIYDISCERMRFNRQAQLVHFAHHEHALSIPWRDAHFFTTLGVVGAGQLVIVGPRPEVLQALVRTGRNRPVKRPFVGGTATFDIADYNLDANLQRLEFIRRYMEGGLEAIRPPPDAEVCVPSGHRQAPGPEEGWSAWIPYLGLRGFYYLGLGPLVDRIVDKRIADFRWPEEIERLCAPGADLSGIDTTPVTPKPGIFYKMGGYGELLYVDSRGIPIKGIHG